MLTSHPLSQYSFSCFFFPPEQLLEINSSMHAYSEVWYCLTLCNPMDYSRPDSSVHGIFQARILDWIAISSSRRSSRPRDQTQDPKNPRTTSPVSPALTGRFFIIEPPRKPSPKSSHPSLFVGGQREQNIPIKLRWHLETGKQTGSSI